MYADSTKIRCSIFVDSVTTEDLQEEGDILHLYRKCCETGTECPLVAM